MISSGKHISKTLSPGFVKNYCGFSFYYFDYAFKFITGLDTEGFNNFLGESTIVANVFTLGFLESFLIFSGQNSHLNHRRTPIMMFDRELKNVIPIDFDIEFKVEKLKYYIRNRIQRRR